MSDLVPETLVGKPVEALTTPCLLVDEDALQYNLTLLADYFAERHCKLRPHFKSHKCVTIARRQIAAGSTSGITCAKVSEAEVLVAGGVDDVLIANQVVGGGKVRRLAQLNQRATVRVAVDSVENVVGLGEAAREANVTIGVLVEVDVGMNRCGVPPGRPTLELAGKVAETDGLRFDGLQGFEGHLVMTKDQERRRLTLEAMQPLVETRELLTHAGLPVQIVSSGGTGTYDVTGNMEGIDEVQCGSYALVGACYKSIRPEFRNACHVLATVISARPKKVVLDVGLKGLGCEFGPPLLSGFPEAKVLYVAEEHTVIENVTVSVGDRVRLVPSHGCTTHNLYRRFWVVSRFIGSVAAVWPIEGSGCLE